MNLFQDLELNLANFMTPEFLSKALKIGIYVVIGFVILRIIIFIVKRTVRKRVSSQTMMLISKTINYIGLGVILLVVLRVLGLSLATLLGAAGIVGLAIGIASQTTLSNMISGVFLVSEKPFEVGDVIRVGGTTGIVQSVDLMSTKIRTFDNQFVRMPNETIIKTEVTNITRFPIRRMDFNVSVAYKEHLPRVKEILLDIARTNPDCLDEPEPLYLYREFGDSGIEILLGVWFEKANFLKVKNSVFEAIHARFSEEDIEIPFPHVSLYTGEETHPLPVSLSKSSERERRKRSS